MQEQLERVLDVTKMVRADCERDAIKLDVTPFTAKAIGEALGSTLAMISALAACVAKIAEELQKETTDAPTS